MSDKVMAREDSVIMRFHAVSTAAKYRQRQVISRHEHTYKIKDNGNTNKHNTQQHSKDKSTQ